MMRTSFQQQFTKNIKFVMHFGGNVLQHLPERKSPKLDTYKPDKD